jgi:uncharacterized membrane protein
MAVVTSPELFNAIDRAEAFERDLQAREAAARARWRKFWMWLALAVVCLIMLFAGLGVGVFLGNLP